jgi:predicted Zn-dependent protease
VKRLIAFAILLSCVSGVLYYSQRNKADARVGPQGMLNTLAETQREISRIPAGVTRISTQEEEQIGDSMARSYAHRSHPLQGHDAEMQQYVAAVGLVVSSHARRKLDYRFHYIPDPNLINAFALPGGHVFIGKGLIGLMKSEDELASVLGHEVEHIDNYHCVERVQLDSRLRHIPLAELIELPVSLFQAGYSKEQELEADRDGTYLAIQAGYSPQGAIHLFQAFGKLHREYVLKAETPHEELSQVAIEGIVGYFRSHPLPDERESQIREIALKKKWPNPPLRALRVRVEAAPLARE